MSEKIYKTMSRSGKSSLTIGIILLVIGITSGVLLIINGARLLRGKSEIMI